MTTFVRKSPKATPQVLAPEAVSKPGPIFSHGVDPEEASRSLASSLRYVADDPTQPFCTCVSKTVGFGFDPSIGVYLHADPECWRPSRAYYEAALRAGVLASPTQKGSA